MKAAFDDNMKNNISYIYSPHEWKGHGLMAHLQTSYCAQNLKHRILEKRKRLTDDLSQINVALDKLQSV